MRQTISILVVALVALGAGAVAWHTRDWHSAAVDEREPPESNKHVENPLSHLKKVQAMVEVGTSRRDYAVALGEANFAISTFTNPSRGQSEADFLAALNEAVKWYRAAAGLWDRQAEAPVPVGYCTDAGLEAFRATELCDSYPELTTAVPGEAPQAGMSAGFSVESVNLGFLLAAAGSKNEGSKGLIYALAIQESWKRAAFALGNAERRKNHQPLLTASNSVFKVGKKAEIAFLYSQAAKRQDASR